MSDTKQVPGKVEKSDSEWRKELTPMQYAVLREKATERPFSGEYEYTKTPGTYVCAGCGQTLSNPMRNSIPAAAGRASLARHPRTTSMKNATSVTA